ncbi:hypothetical protein HK097_000073 [Rhizophlyctis rosea]|uniref:ubiquitinyl hydrolase 1 n=1 Tax=Rhizophlyctis rosea TaxID=64517 RepID=A0AAD5SL60_9FUNG|nr:hypothetical protein HK097_000073 [Rhizophlyctis rosea]
MAGSELPSIADLTLSPGLTRMDENESQIATNGMHRRFHKISGSIWHADAVDTAAAKSSKEEPSVKYSQEGSSSKDHHDVKMSSNEEDKQGQKAQKAGVLENVVKGRTMELHSKMAGEGIDAKNEVDSMLDVKTDEKGTLKPAPVCIIESDPHKNVADEEKVKLVQGLLKRDRQEETTEKESAKKPKLDIEVSELETKRYLKITFVDKAAKEHGPFDILLPKTARVPEILAATAQRVRQETVNAKKEESKKEEVKTRNAVNRNSTPASPTTSSGTILLNPAKLKLIEAMDNKFHRYLIYDRVQEIADGAQLFVEEKQEEEQAGDGDKWIGVFHYYRDPIKTHGVPFRFLVKEYETFSQTKKRLFPRMEPALGDDDILYDKLQSQQQLGADHVDKSVGSLKGKDPIRIHEIPILQRFGCICVCNSVLELTRNEIELIPEWAKRTQWDRYDVDCKELTTEAVRKVVDFLAYKRDNPRFFGELDDHPDQIDSVLAWRPDFCGTTNAQLLQLMTATDILGQEHLYSLLNWHYVKTHRLPRRIVRGLTGSQIQLRRLLRMLTDFDETYGIKYKWGQELSIDEGILGLVVDFVCGLFVMEVQKYATNHGTNENDMDKADLASAADYLLLHRYNSRHDRNEFFHRKTDGDELEGSLYSFKDVRNKEFGHHKWPDWRVGQGRLKFFLKLAKKLIKNVDNPGTSLANLKSLKTALNSYTQELKQMERG